MEPQVDPVLRKKGPQEGPKKAPKGAQNGSWMENTQNTKNIDKNIVFFNDFEGPEGPKMASKGASKELLRQACIQEASNFAPRGLRMPPRAKKNVWRTSRSS